MAFRVFDYFLNHGIFLAFSFVLGEFPSHCFRFTLIPADLRAIPVIIVIISPISCDFRQFQHKKRAKHIYSLCVSPIAYSLQQDDLQFSQNCIFLDCIYFVDSFSTTSYGSNVRSFTSSPSVRSSSVRHATMPSSFASNESDVIEGNIVFKYHV